MANNGQENRGDSTMSLDAQRILDVIKIAIVVTDEDGTITDVNDAVAVLFGYGSSQLIGQRFEALIAECHRDAYRAVREVAMREGSCERDIVARHKEGREFDVKLGLTSASKQHGPTITIAIIDTSQTKRAEKRAAESARTLETLATNLPGMVYRCRNDRDWSMEYVSPGSLALTGYPASDLAANKVSFASLIHKDDRDRVWEEVQAGVAVRRPFQLNYRIITKDDTVKAVWEQGCAIYEDGVLVALEGYITDVTPLKKADREIRESDARFRQLADNINHVFWITDWKTRELLYVSPGYVRIFGRTCESLHADRLSWRELVHPEDRDRVVTRFRQSAILGEATDLEYRIIRDDGQERWVHDAATPVFDDSGAVDRIVGVAEDITARKRAEQERESLSKQLRHAQKMEAIGTLASGIAHDFNNVLTAIMGYTEVARSEAPAGTLSDALAGIARATEQAAGITRALLTFSRKTAAAKKPLRLAHVVEETVAMLRRMIPTSVAITTDTSRSQDLWVSADSAQIQQVVMNLAINARDAMPNGGELTLTVSRRCGTDGESAVLNVSDTGSGMAAEVVNRLFEPFFTTKPRGQGTGLGMAVVHGVIQNHGGDIQITSEPGKGTSITVTLPTCPPGRQSRTSDEHPRDPARASGKTVLLAEDNEEIRSITERALRSAGFRVIVATSGTEATRRFEAHTAQIDLLLLDVDLPGRTGISCLELMRKRRPDVAAVIMTGNADFAHEVQTQADVAVLLKPFTPSDVVTTLQQTLDNAMNPSSLTA